MKNPYSHDVASQQDNGKANSSVIKKEIIKRSETSLEPNVDENDGGSKLENLLLDRRALFEISYRFFYPDVADAITLNQFESAAHHFDLYGAAEERLSPGKIDRIFDGFDQKWYRENYGVQDGDMIALFIHFLIGSKNSAHSPNCDFDEEYFLLENADMSIFHSGYVTFVCSDDKGALKVMSVRDADRLRMRAKSYADMIKIEKFLPGLTNPGALENIESFRNKIFPLFSLSIGKKEKRLNILVPNLAPEIFFGGYGALFQFCAWLKKNGTNFRFIITEQNFRKGAFQIVDSFYGMQPVYDVLKSAEIQFLSDEIEIGINEDVMCYSMWAAHIGKKIADRSGGKLFYFIQEYEHSFHTYGSAAFLGSSSLAFPHIPIFNSPELARYFEENKLGVFSGSSTPAKNIDFFVFRHVIPCLKLPNVDELNARTKRKLLFYARPERHAERNLFEVGILALEQCIRRGVFGDEWEFHGVGSLGSHFELELFAGRRIHCIPKAPLGQYYDYLSSFDIGLSFIYAPHPGVVHFEMAAAGLVTVTNTFQNRTKEHLADISNNLIGAELDLESIIEAISLARERVELAQARISAAKLSLPTSWPDSFNEMSNFIRLVKE